MGEKGDMMKPQLTTREILRDLWEEKKLTLWKLAIYLPLLCAD